MNTSLETQSTAEGIVCSFPADLMAAGAKKPHEMAGKPFGLITYTPPNKPAEMFSMWTAEPPAQLPAKTFMSLEAAQFYMLAAAAEYLVVTA